MIPTNRRWLNTLRLGLLFSAVGWGVSFFFTFVSWDQATNQLYRMGASPIDYQPLLDYWLRMASVAFGCIGLGSIAAALRPQTFLGFIRFLVPFHFVVGLTLTITAWRIGLTPKLHPTFGPDILFCLTTGTLICLPLLLGKPSHHSK